MGAARSRWTVPLDFVGDKGRAAAQATGRKYAPPIATGSMAFLEVVARETRLAKRSIHHSLNVGSLRVVAPVSECCEDARQEPASLTSVARGEEGQ